MGNKRMTNVAMGNGEFVSGIRKNDGLGRDELHSTGAVGGLMVKQYTHHPPSST